MELKTLTFGKKAKEEVKKILPESYSYKKYVHMGQLVYFVKNMHGEIIAYVEKTILGKLKLVISSTWG